MQGLRRFDRTFQVEFSNAYRSNSDVHVRDNDRSRERLKLLQTVGKLPNVAFRSNTWIQGVQFLWEHEIKVQFSSIFTYF